MEYLVYVEKYLKKTLQCGIVPALLCVLLQGTATAAQDAEVGQPLAEGLYVAPAAAAMDARDELKAGKSGGDSDLQLAMNQVAAIENGVDTDDDIVAESAWTTASAEPIKLAAARTETPAASQAVSPPTPPPDKVVLAVDEKTLVAANTPSTSQATGKTQTAPEPKTSKNSSISTPFLAGAGVALAVGVAVAAGGGSGSDDSAVATTSSGGTSTGSTEVISLADLVRIGDDSDYNGKHPDKFKQNRPSGLSWTGSFTVNNVNTVSSAHFKYTVAGSKVGNPIYVNGQQAGRLCNPGNTAWNVEDCSTNITGYIHSGANDITVRCAIDQSDTATPYDDVELYTLRIELAH